MGPVEKELYPCTHLGYQQLVCGVAPGKEALGRASLQLDSPALLCSALVRHGEMSSLVFPPQPLGNATTSPQPKGK